MYKLSAQPKKEYSKTILRAGGWLVWIVVIRRFGPVVKITATHHVVQIGKQNPSVPHASCFTFGHGAVTARSLD